jgi:DNA polymerase-2
MIKRLGNPDELVFKGLEAVRSDWSTIAREFQQQLYRLVFNGQPFEDYVRATVELVKSGQCDDKLVLRKRLRRKLDEYQKNIPPHVRAARKAEEARRAKGLPSNEDFSGGWVEYLMTLGGPEPRLYRESAIDYQFYVDKQLAPVADAILFFKSSSLAEITDKQMGLF